MVWTPWRSPKDVRAEEAAQADEGCVDAGMGGWRLRGDALRVATYYRVMHCRVRAEAEAKRRARGARFGAWWTSFVELQKRERERAEAVGAAADERARRGDLASAGTRMAQRPERLYLAGTAKYRARATTEEARRRLLTRGTRTRIEQAAEIGPRLHENLQEIARRCERERRHGDG